MHATTLQPISSSLSPDFTLISLYGLVFIVCFIKILPPCFTNSNLTYPLCIIQMPPPDPFALLRGNLSIFLILYLDLFDIIYNFISRVWQLYIYFLSFYLTIRVGSIYNSTFYKVCSMEFQSMFTKSVSTRK